MLGLIIFYQLSSDHMVIPFPSDFESTSSKNKFIIKKQLAFPVLSLSFYDLSSIYNPYTLHLPEGVKAVYSDPAYLPYMQSTS